MNAYSLSGIVFVVYLLLVLAIRALVPITPTGEFVDNRMKHGSRELSEMSLYLPIILNNASLPPIPTLYDIENMDGDGAYSINWSASSSATSYTLEDANNLDFSSPSEAYHGPNTTITMAGKAIGNYYYRVRAENSMGYSNWSEIKTTSVTKQSELICETHGFGTVGVAWPITASGITEKFIAENNMRVETVEVVSVLKALFLVKIYVSVGINGEKIANKTHYVFSNAYTSYYLNANVANELHIGDEIYYHITKAVGDTEAWIRWGNYVKLCGH